MSMAKRFLAIISYPLMPTTIEEDSKRFSLTRCHSFPEMKEFGCKQRSSSIPSMLNFDIVTLFFDLSKETISLMQGNPDTSPRCLRKYYVTFEFPFNTLSPSPISSLPLLWSLA
ncbi:hypothetical protein V6N12_024074 [Hibiscus sabdariffa]|uniref:Uncharacterized protein n=1 Tax=Hibiscus sabdariffa TaxID=183260 RepID=A0ABR2FZI7_9ROSI